MTELHLAVDRAVRSADIAGRPCTWDRLYFATGAPPEKDLARVTAELTASGAIARVEGPDGHPEFIPLNIDALLAEIAGYLLAESERWAT